MMEREEQKKKKTIIINNRSKPWAFDYAYNIFYATVIIETYKIVI